jgi:hypothetical protein
VFALQQCCENLNAAAVHQRGPQRLKGVLVSVKPEKPFLAYARVKRSNRIDGLILAMFWTRVVTGACMIFAIAVAAADRYHLIHWNETVLLALIVTGFGSAIATLVLMTQIGFRVRGLRYAVDNLAFAILLLPLVGIGLFVAPGFMMSELKANEFSPIRREA